MSEKLFFKEVFKIKNIRRLEKRKNEILSFYYKEFCYFQNERSKLIDEFKSALNKNCINYTFSNWYRVVNFEFSNQPLSAKGSLLDPIGGRFNIGNLDQYKFPSFPALYVAEDNETAYREKFQLGRIKKINGLTADELALNQGKSTSHIAIEGNINTIVDITKPKKLQDFYKIISQIKLPKSLELEAKQLKIPVPYQVKSLKELWTSILDEQWRRIPMQIDVPANSQIFGQIANISGIEGILYPTRMKTNKKCLALFVKNFDHSPSYISIMDKTPKDVRIKSLNSETFHKLM